MARLALTSNYAVAYAVKMCDVDVIPVYPITPQTTIAEKLSEFVANGELNAEIIHVESEHSALSAAIGAAAVGARVFTATCSQGLMLAYELLPIAAGLRLPIVMAVPARAVSAPISIHCDYGDVMLARDTGWIIMITSTAQEVFDTVIQAFKISENTNVLLPSMIAYDGFLMSHTIEPVEIPDDEEIVKKLLPEKGKWHKLNPEKPITMGPLALPDWYYEIKYQQVIAMKEAYRVCKEVFQEYGRIFGRSYDVVETYEIEDAEYVFITYGGAWGFLQEAIDRVRKEGLKVGGLKIRLLRPFPVNEMIKYLSNVKGYAVIDRAISFGMPMGPVFQDLSTILKQYEINVPGINFIHGIGQRTMYIDDFIQAIKYTIKKIESREIEKEAIYLGLRS